jgi:hypothetical protein
MIQDVCPRFQEGEPKLQKYIPSFRIWSPNFKQPTFPESNTIFQKLEPSFLYWSRHFINLNPKLQQWEPNHFRSCNLCFRQWVRSFTLGSCISREGGTPVGELKFQSWSSSFAGWGQTSGVSGIESGCLQRLLGMLWGGAGGGGWAKDGDTLWHWVGILQWGMGVGGHTTFCCTTFCKVQFDAFLVQ